MAKSSVVGFDLKTIRAMLTAAERKVFDSSLGKEIAAAGRAELQAAIRQARTLRDKWRDLYAKQTRTTKRTTNAGTATNDRSREKSELFAGALQRLEARLVEVGTAAKTAVKSVKKAAVKAVAAPAAKKGVNLEVARPVTKRVRTAGHRAARAGVKAELKQVAAKKTAKR
jgi:hypothetical protein